MSLSSGNSLDRSVGINNYGLQVSGTLTCKISDALVQVHPFTTSNMAMAIQIPLRSEIHRTLVRHSNLRSHVITERFIWGVITAVWGQRI